MLTVGVTGSGGGVGGAVLRSLKASGLATRVVCFDSDPWAPGLYSAQQGFLVPPAHSETYMATLLDKCERESVEALIIGTDTEILPVSAHARELRSIGCVPICGSVSVNRALRDKYRCAELLRQAGFPFVRTEPIRHLDALATDVGFPLIIKPAAGSASRGVMVVFDAQEARALRNPADYVAQEYLLTREWNKQKLRLTRDELYSNYALVQKDEISIQVLVDQDGVVMGVFTSRNVLKDGVPVVICPIADDDTGATALAVEMAGYLGTLGLSGPCNFQCKITDEGPKFFEVNPRFTGITAVRAALHFNEVEACLRRLVLDEPRSEVRACLQTDYGHVCSRYVTEYMIPAASVARIQAKGQCAGSGWSVHL